MDIEERKKRFTENLAFIRKKRGYTQLELAEALHYSDKSISKWERGEGFPDIFTLKEMAEFLGVTVDTFFSEKPIVKKKRSLKKEIVIPLLAIGIAWLVIALLFAIGEIFFKEQIKNCWLLFIYGVPITGIIYIVFSAVYHSRLNILIAESITIWGIGLSIYLTTLTLTTDVQGLYLIFIVCIPIEILAILYFILKTDRNFFKKLFHKKKKE